MTISKSRAELIDGLLSDYKKSEDLLGEDGILKHLTKAVVERAIEAEMAHHRQYNNQSEISGKCAKSMLNRTVVKGFII